MASLTPQSTKSTQVTTVMKMTMMVMIIITQRVKQDAHTERGRNRLPGGQLGHQLDHLQWILRNATPWVPNKVGCQCRFQQKKVESWTNMVPLLNLQFAGRWSRMEQTFSDERSTYRLSNMTWRNDWQEPTGKMKHITVLFSISKSQNLGPGNYRHILEGWRTFRLQKNIIPDQNTIWSFHVTD